MSAYEKLGKTVSMLLGVCLLVIVPLSFFWSGAVRDFVLFFLILAAIFYFEWLASDVLEKITQRLDSIDLKLSELKRDRELENL
jgi:hypothetical protein